jgi:hypothetical protein
MPHLRCPPVWRKIGWDRRQASADQFSQLYASEGRPSIAPGEWNLHGRTVRFLLLTVPRLRTPHRAEDIGSALKGGVNVCQRQLVNEVLGPLVTEFVRNFGREGATPIQRVFSAAPMPAFSVASRPSNSSDIMPPDRMSLWRTLERGTE